jgi:hypothetical protein
VELPVIPYVEIAETADRWWSFRLLDRLVTPELSNHERDEVVSAMQAVSDRRTVPILERLLTDRSRSSATRGAASEILRGMQYLDIEWPDDTLRRWWKSGDAVLRRNALLSMDAAACPDIVRAVAADPAHPLRITALGRMTFFFDGPADLRLAGIRGGRRQRTGPGRAGTAGGAGGWTGRRSSGAARRRRTCSRSRSAGAARVPAATRRPPHSRGPSGGAATCCRPAGRSSTRSSGRGRRSCPG